MKLAQLCSRVALDLFNNRKRVIVGVVKKYDIKKYASGACRGVDIDKYRFMTQNPLKDSAPARRARKGALILWIFKSGYTGFYAKWENGKFVRLAKEVS
jgi:hypothetical protein